MRYEDFLETLDPTELDRLINGHAHVVQGNVAAAYEQHLPRVIEAERAERGGGKQVWTDYLDGMTHEWDVAQIAGDLEILHRITGVMVAMAQVRMVDLHRSHCDECREQAEREEAKRDEIAEIVRRLKQAIEEARREHEQQQPWQDPETGTFDL